MTTYTFRPWTSPHRRARRGIVRLLAAGLLAVVLLLSGTVSAFAQQDTVLFQLTGRGGAVDIRVIPASNNAYPTGKLPSQSTTTIDPSVRLIQISATAATSYRPDSIVGCSITLNGQMVAAQAPGPTALCTYQR